MSTLLTYAVAPTTVYASSATSGTSIASLTLTVTNNTGADVALAYIDFTVPDVLTTAFGSIGASAPTGSGWSFGAKSQGSNVFRAYLTNPSAVFEDKASIALTLDNIAVGTGVGQTANLTIDQVDTDGAVTPPPLTVAITSSQLSIEYFQAHPVNLEPGKSATLSWKTTDANSVSLDATNFHVDNLHGEGSYVVTPSLNTTYTLTVEGLGAIMQRQITISVSVPQVLSTSPSPLQPAYPGQVVPITFNVYSAEGGYGLLSSDPSTQYPVLLQEGQEYVPVDVPAAANLSFTVYDANGAASPPWSINFPLLAISSFNVPPETVPHNSLVGLTWQTQNATKCTLYANGVAVPGTIPLQATQSVPFWIVATEDTRFQLVAYLGKQSVKSAQTEMYTSQAAPFPIGRGPKGTLAQLNYGTIYIANYFDTLLSVVNPPTAAVAETIDVGFYPAALAVVDTSLYATTNSNNTISVIDTATQKVTASVQAGTNPVMDAIAVVGTSLYIANNEEVVVFDTSTHKVTDTVTGVGRSPHQMLLVDTLLYVTNRMDGTVSVVDTATQKVTATVTVGQSPRTLAAAGSSVYVANEADGTLSVISTATQKVSATLSVGAKPKALLVLNDTLYVANSGANTVSVIDLPTNKVTTTLTVGAGPAALTGISVNLINKAKLLTLSAVVLLYVPNHGADTVSVVDTATNTVVATLTVGANPVAVATTDTNTYYVINEGACTVSAIGQPLIAS